MYDRMMTGHQPYTCIWPQQELITMINGNLDLEAKKFYELFDKIECLQRAVAAMCAAYHDFTAGYSEDITEVKRQLHELRRNKVWIPRERV
jgi:hypothetical protein